MASHKKKTDNKIYVWTTDSYEQRDWIGPNRGKGWLKIGDAINVKKRIGTSILLPEEKKILLEESAKYNNCEECFRDKLIHKILVNSFKTYSINGEWYECTVDQVKQAILAAKARLKRVKGTATENFAMRKEQKEAVEKTAAYFAQYPGECKHFLWNAKMRFGKTFAAYQLTKKMGWKKILVLTFKPAVKSAWQEDLYFHIDFSGWQFASNETDIDPSEEFRNRDPEKPFVWFASFQDMLGKDKTGNNKAHNAEAYSTNWDCIILDEYHFGAWRESSKELFSSETQSEIGNSDDFSEEELRERIRADHYLYLSGTPFRAIAENEFDDDQIFNWTYPDEQKRKAEMSKDPQSPYQELPEMKFYLYQMSEEFRQVATDPELNGFDLNEFFRASESKTESGKFDFAHAEQVQAWLDQVFYKKPTDPRKLVDFLKNKTQPMSPFGNAALKEELRHTVWFLPSVAACKAMGNLLSGKYHYGDVPYSVIVCAGSEAGIGSDALSPVLREMKNPEQTATITLTCGKLTTGVTIPAWNGILMLRNTTSPETYFQAAFRIQSPWTVKDHQNKKSIKKKVCYVFDYAPDRALTEIAEYAIKLANNETGDPITQIKDFINYLPVLMDDGGQMRALDAKNIFLLTTQGGGESLLAKRWMSKRLAPLKESSLLLLLANKDLTKLLQAVEDIEGTGNQLTEILNASGSLTKLRNKIKKKVNSKGSSDKDTDIQQLLDAYQKKLRRIISMLPFFMYLTDPIEKSLGNLINQDEDKLFKRILGVDKKTFKLLVDMKLLDSSLINYRIAGFAETDYQSMGYTGINKHKEDKDNE